MSNLNLTLKQRHHLDQESKVRQEAADRRVRSLALLAVNAGQPVSETARWFRVSRQTIHHWIASAKEEPLDEALSDHWGPGRPPLCTPEGRRLLRQALKRSPQDFDYPNTSWTLPLLQEHLQEKADLELSQDTLRRQLHAWRYVWKRFRYELIGDPETEKKSPDSSSDSSVACLERSVG